MTQTGHEDPPAADANPPESIAQVAAPEEAEVPGTPPKKPHSGLLPPDEGQELPAVDMGDAKLEYEFLQGQLVVPDDVASLTRRSLGYRILHNPLERTIAAGAVVLVTVAGGTVLEVSKGGGKSSSRTVATGTQNPGKPSGNGASGTPEAKPPVAESASAGLDLTSVGKDRLSLSSIANPGDTLPAVPVYDWLKDPKEDPSAYMDSFFANYSYFMSTRLKGNAQYSLDNLTDDPAMIAKLQTDRENVGAEILQKPVLVWYWSEGPLEWKTTENRDGSLSITLASGTIYTYEFTQNPDDGWLPPSSISKNTDGTRKLTAVSITLGHWTASHPDVTARGNLIAMNVQGYRI